MYPPQKYVSVMTYKLFYLDVKPTAVETYTGLLKDRYKNDQRYASDRMWLPFTPAKFTRLGFSIYKTKRTRKETEDFAEKNRSGGLSSSLAHSAPVKENISDIFSYAEHSEGGVQIILVEGAPGVGKTMLLKEIAYLWATGELLTETKVVLHLLLHHHYFNNIDSPKALFFHDCKIEKNANTYASYFCSNSGEGLVILLDGLDENLKAMEKGSFLLDTLILKNYFPRARIVITSRPHATRKLQIYISYRVDIIGFNDQNRRDFVKENILKQEDAKKLESYLKDHIVIDTLCYIPLNLSIILFLFTKKLERGKDFSLPTTQTELIKKAVEMTALHNLQRMKPPIEIDDFENLPKPYCNILNKFCALAYNGLVENKSVFTEDDIKKLCQKPTDAQIEKTYLLHSDPDNVKNAWVNCLGLIQTEEFFAGNDGYIKLSNFVHFSVQELLAAWSISFWHKNLCNQIPLGCGFKPLMECAYFYTLWRDLKEKFWEGVYMNMWSLYVGLTQGEDLAFKHFLSGNSLCCVFCIHCKQVSVSKNILNNKINTLWLYLYLQEAPSNEIIEQLQVVIGKDTLDLREVKLEEKDVDLLGYILSRPYLTSQWKKVNLSSCDIDDYKCEVLHKVLTRNDGIPKPKMQDLSLCSNNLKSCGTAVARVAQNQEINSLNLSGNALKNLSDFKLCIHLEMLDMSNNHLTSKDALELFPALKSLKKLKELKLGGNLISNDENVVDAIGSALCCCDSLESLDLESNMVKDKVMIMFDIIKSIRSSTSQELSFSMSKKAIAFISILHYCSNLPHDRNMLKEKIYNLVVLNISCCGLQDNDAQTLGTSLHLFRSLQELDISENTCISDASSKELTKGLLLTSTLKHFNYDKCSFNKQSIGTFKMIFYLRHTSSRVFRCAPSEICALIFLLECISELDEDVAKSNDIVKTVGCVTEVDLRYEGSGDKVNDENIGLLCPLLISWFRQLAIVHINNNGVTAEATESIILSMLQIYTFKQIVVVGNPIVDSELSITIFSTIKELHERKLLSFTCNQDTDHVYCEAILFIMKCLHKIENAQGLLNNIADLTVHSSECVFSDKFVDYINFLPSLQYLDVSGTTITEKGIIEMGTYVTTNHKLEKLDLSNNNLKNLQIHSQSVSKKPLKIVRLNSCNITDEVFCDVISSLVMFSDVELFELEGNCIGNEGIYQFCSLLTAQNYNKVGTTITSLNLSNNKLDSSSAENIMKIVLLCNIKALDITANKLSDASTRVLTKGILLMPEFKRFRYDENSFTEQTINVFKMVRQLCDMTRTVFKCAVSKFNALIFILECLGELEIDHDVQSNDIVKNLSGVTKLDFRTSDEIQNELNDESIRILCPLLKWFIQLEVVCLKNNNIGVEATEPLVLSMLQLRAFKEVQVIGNSIANSKLSMCIFSTMKDLHDRKLQSITCESNQKFDHVKCHSILFIMECLNKIKNAQNCVLLVNIVDLIVRSSECEFSHKFVDYINFLPGLQCLAVSSTTITAFGIKMLSTYLTPDHKLKRLDLCNSNLKNLRIHGQSVSKKPLEIVKFNNCNITDEVLYDLIRSLVMFSDMDVFELEGNCFGNKGINQFCSLLQTQSDSGLSTTITALNLSNNKLDLSSAEDVMEIVKACNIEVLNISHNCLDNCLGGNHSIFTYFEVLNVSTITELDISSNNKREGNAIQFIQNISCLSGCKDLRILNISNNCLIDSEAVMDEIYCCFLKCINETNLGKIKCICNDNPAKAKIEFAYDLVKNLYSLDGHVEVIDLRGCPKAVQELISVMANELAEVSKIIATAVNFHAGKIKRIDFACNSLRINESFDCALRKLTSLEELDLSMNKITSKTFIHLVKGFLFTRHLKLGNLYLENNPCTNDKENHLLLEIIDHIRSSNDSFKCLPANFNAFLFILECFNGINTKNCDVHDKIVHMRSLDLSSLVVGDLEKEGLSRPSKKQAKLSCTDAQKFCRYLNHFQSLEIINLGYNNIKDDAKNCLVISVLRNSSIVNVRLEENPIYKKGRIVTLFKTLEDIRKSQDEFNFKDLPEVLQAFVELLAYIDGFADKTCDIVENIEYLYIKDFYQPRKHTII